MTASALYIQVSDKEKLSIIKDILGKNYIITSHNYPILSSVIDNIERADTAFTLAELLPITNSLITGSAFISMTVSGTAILSIALIPVGSMIKIIEALQTGHKLYSFRAAAYAVTAWAFSKPIPGSSPKILFNIRNGDYVKEPEAVEEYKLLWAKSAKHTIQYIQGRLAVKNLQKKQLQFILQSIGNGEEKKLCLMLLKGFESKMTSFDKMVWKSNYSIVYPG